MQETGHSCLLWNESWSTWSMHPCAVFPQEGQFTQPVNWPPGLLRGVRQLAGLLWCPATGTLVFWGGVWLLHEWWTWALCLLHPQPYGKEEAGRTLERSRSGQQQGQIGCYWARVPFNHVEGLEDWRMGSRKALCFGWAKPKQKLDAN